MVEIACKVILTALIACCSFIPGAAESRITAFDMVHHNPGEAPVSSRYLNPEYLKAAGYDAMVFFLFDAAQFGLDWKSFDADVFPEGSEGLQWVRGKEKEINRKYTAAKEAGLDVYCMLDMLVLPRGIVEKYKERVVDGKGRIDISKPFVRECVGYLIKSMFATFPQLDGLVIRTGETYLHDAPFYIGNHPCIHGLDTHSDLINILREEVCVKLGKKLIYRTWDMGNFHTLPSLYLGVTDKVEPHENLLFSIKHTATDFWRMGISSESPEMSTFDSYWIDESGKHGVPFNPCLGIGRHRQIVEVQCQREYEGKGAHPNYIARGVIEGFRELQDCGKVRSMRELAEADDSLLGGVWTWSRGGGWGGPYIENEYWIDLNARVMACWSRDTSKSEEECFREVMRQRGVSESNIEDMRRLCLLTEEGVLKGQYSAFGGSYVNWTRDDSMTGDNFLNGYLEDIVRRGDAERYIAEKDEAVEIWREIESLSGRISLPDMRDERFVRISSTYGRIKYEILAAAWRIMTRGKEAEITGAQLPREEIRDAIAVYDRAWREWRQLKETEDCCPSLYKAKADFFGSETGLDATIDRYRKLTDI